MPVSDELLLKLIYQEENKQALDEARAKLDKMTDAEKSAIKEQAKAVEVNQQQKKSFLELNAAIDLFGKGLRIAKGFIEESIGSTMQYAKQVRDLGTNLGITAEETSKIIQTADDYGIEVGTVTAALQMAVKKGFAPNIESLAKLADQYKSIKDPVQRAAAMTEVFGRNWTALTPMLKEGGDAIRASAAEAEKLGLVLSEKDTQAARQLEINIDNLTDRFNALKTSVGNAVIPVLNQAADGLNFMTEAVSKATTKDEQYRQAIIQATIALGPNSEAVRNLSAAYQDYLIKQKQTADGLKDLTQKYTDADYGVRHLHDSELALALALEAGNRQIHDSTAEFDRAVLATRNWADAQTLANNQLAAVKLGMSEFTKQILFNTASEGLNGDQQLQLARSLGLINEASYAAAAAALNLKRQREEGIITDAQYLKQVYDLNNTLGDMPKDIAIRTELSVIGKEELDDIKGRVSNVRDSAKGATDEVGKTASAATDKLRGISDVALSRIKDVEIGVSKSAQTEAAKATRDVNVLGDEADRITRKTYILKFKIETEGEMPKPPGAPRQMGGPVVAGLGYNVGEMGMERFIPNQSGVILPASITNTTINNNAYSITTDRAGLAMMIQRQQMGAAFNARMG